MLDHASEFDQDTLTHLLTIAKRSTHNLGDLVQLILDTNQLAAGQLRVNWYPIQPSALIAEAVEPFQAQLTINNQALVTQIDERVRVTWGDPTLLRRVIQNLLGNAIKFTPLGGRIDIGLTLTPKEDMVELRVRDTGSGIQPAALPYIFDRYYQAREGDRQGSGLGLYFCRLAIEAHRGTIRAVSQLGSGTTITVVLPVVPPHM
jgi:signal transduction histidine kinase